MRTLGVWLRSQPAKDRRLKCLAPYARHSGARRLPHAPSLLQERFQRCAMRCQDSARVGEAACFAAVWPQQCSCAACSARSRRRMHAALCPLAGSGRVRSHALGRGTGKGAAGARVGNVQAGPGQLPAARWQALDGRGHQSGTGHATAPPIPPQDKFTACIDACGQEFEGKMPKVGAALVSLSAWPDTRSLPPPAPLPLCAAKVGHRQAAAEVELRQRAAEWRAVCACIGVEGACNVTGLQGCEHLGKCLALAHAGGAGCAPGATAASASSWLGPSRSWPEGRPMGAVLPVCATASLCLRGSGASRTAKAVAARAGAWETGKHAGGARTAGCPRSLQAKHRPSARHSHAGQCVCCAALRIRASPPVSEACTQWLHTNMPSCMHTAVELVVLLVAGAAWAAVGRSERARSPGGQLGRKGGHSYRRGLAQSTSPFLGAWSAGVLLAWRGGRSARLHGPGQPRAATSRAAPRGTLRPAPRTACLPGLHAQPQCSKAAARPRPWPARTAPS